MSINFSELRTIHEEASEVEGEGRVGGSASASANGSNGSVGHSNGHGHGHGHGHVHAQASSSNLGRFVGGEMPAPAPQMQIDPALISPERRVGHKASQGRHGSADADGAGPSLAGTKRTYADRLSVTPAPGGAGAHTLAAYGNEAGYARTGNGNSNGNGNGGSYQDGQDGDEDEDEDDDEGEYEDEGDTSGYGHAGYIQEGSDGHDGNGMRAQRGTSEDEARIASGSSSDRTPTGVNIQGAVGEGGAGRLKKKAKEGTTCDNCRKRKIKCKEDTDPYADPLDKSCDGCRKLGIECTYDYVRKKPGRKNG